MLFYNQQNNNNRSIDANNDPNRLGIDVTLDTNANQLLQPNTSTLMESISENVISQSFVAPTPIFTNSNADTVYGSEADQSGSDVYAIIEFNSGPDNQASHGIREDDQSPKSATVIDDGGEFIADNELNNDSREQLNVISKADDDLVISSYASSELNTDSQFFTTGVDDGNSEKQVIGVRKEENDQSSDSDTAIYYGREDGLLSDSATVIGSHSQLTASSCEDDQSPITSYAVRELNTNSQFFTTGNDTGQLRTSIVSTENHFVRDEQLRSNSVIASNLSSTLSNNDSNTDIHPTTEIEHIVVNQITSDNNNQLSAANYTTIYINSDLISQNESNNESYNQSNLDNISMLIGVYEHGSHIL